MLPFQSAVQHDLDAVNQLIVAQLHSDVGLVENIGHYIVEAGGKRLRPVLVLLTANCLEYEGERHTELATIIEFIHTATLLHDDVVDMSNLRRGRPTANANWGNAPSILVGDFLYSRAFQMLVSLGSMEIMRILSDATNLISEGEVQQLVNVKNPAVSEASYLEVIRKKTAVLFQAACSSAALLARSDAQQQSAAAAYGLHLGLAFQLMDDVLDYQGTAEALGKNVGDDLAEGKPTLPLIYALACASNDDKKVLAEAITRGRIDLLEDVVAIVRRTNAIEYTTQCATRHAAAARQALEELPRNRFTETMSVLADFALTRSY